MATSQRGYSSATGAIDHPPRSHHLSLPKGGRLKVVLASGDALAVAIGYTVVVVGAGYAEAEGILRSVFVIGGAVVIGVLAMRSQGLLLARVSAVRIVEMTHVTRAAGLLLVGMLAFDRIAGLGFHVRYMVLAGVIAWLCTVASRSVFRAWISVKRANGKHQRSVVVVGCDGEAARLVELFAAHTDLGILVLGVVGDRDAAARNGLAALWLGTADEAERVVLDAKASGVVV